MGLGGIVGTSYSDILAFAYAVINYAVGVSALFTVVSVIITGFRYMFSYGDTKKIEEANKSLIFSLLGLVLVFVAPTVIKFVINQLLSF